MKICLSDMRLKQNTKFEASKKRQFDKMGVKKVKNFYSKTRVILTRVPPEQGLIGTFFLFHIAGGYNLQANSKPLGLIEKRRFDMQT
ncbi:hypothetical protein RCO48_05695 [Peribacillus frigoritolerans]|nr:hypothetical protein [Peribacillus frigoritolerans]